MTAEMNFISTPPISRTSSVYSGRSSGDGSSIFDDVVVIPENIMSTNSREFTSDLHDMMDGSAFMNEKSDVFVASSKIVARPPKQAKKSTESPNSKDHTRSGETKKKSDSRLEARVRDLSAVSREVKRRALKREIERHYRRHESAPTLSSKPRQALHKELGKYDHSRRTRHPSNYECPANAEQAKALEKELKNHYRSQQRRALQREIKYFDRYPRTAGTSRNARSNALPAPRRALYNDLKGYNHSKRRDDIIVDSQVPASSTLAAIKSELKDCHQSQRVGEVLSGGSGQEVLDLYRRRRRSAGTHPGRREGTDSPSNLPRRSTSYNGGIPTNIEIVKGDGKILDLSNHSSSSREGSVATPDVSTTSSKRSKGTSTTPVRDNLNITPSATRDSATGTLGQRLRERYSNRHSIAECPIVEPSYLHDLVSPQPRASSAQLEKCVPESPVMSLRSTLAKMVFNTDFEGETNQASESTLAQAPDSNKPH